MLMRERGVAGVHCHVNRWLNVEGASPLSECLFSPLCVQVNSYSWLCPCIALATTIGICKPCGLHDVFCITKCTQIAEWGIARKGNERLLLEV